MPVVSRAVLSAVVLGLAGAPSLSAQVPITLEDALREARGANAELPLARTDMALADASLGVAKGRLWPTVGIDGDLHSGVPSSYASSDARIQLVGGMTVYDGGRLRADIRGAEAVRNLAGAGYRRSEKDVELLVRLRYGEILALRQEVELMNQGIDQLGRYLDLVDARQQGGEPVQADRLGAEVRRQAARADLEEASRLESEAVLEMNELMGRDPDDVLELAGLPPPVALSLSSDSAWTGVPDVTVAEAAAIQARAEVEGVRAGRRPQVFLDLNLGGQPVLGLGADALLNSGRGAGAELVLGFSLPLWDRGVYRGLLNSAELSVQRADQETTAARRAARLEWNRARGDLEHLSRQIDLRSATVTLARDAYLQAESLYRGGEGTSLEVLDAYDEWIQAGENVVTATQGFRSAEARSIRWGTP